MSSELEVTVDARRMSFRIDRITPNVREALSEVLGEDARALRFALVHQAPRRTGKFSRSFRSRVTSNEKTVMAKVYTTSPLGHLFEGGVQAHEILPKVAHVLAFMGSAGQVFARAVHHPGMRENPFISREFQGDMVEIHRDMEKAVKVTAGKP